MGLLSGLFTRPEPPASHADRLKRAEDALHDLVRRFDALQVEWESVLDKIGRYSARQAARSRRDIEAKLEASSVAAETEATPPPAPTLPANTDKNVLRRMYANGQLRKLGG